MCSITSSMRYFKFFTMFYMIMLVISWTVYGLNPIIEYLILSLFVTLTLIFALFGLYCETKKRKYDEDLYLI